MARSTIRHVFALLGIAARMDLAWLLRDTRYALAGIAADTISNMSTVAGVFLIALRFGGIGSMSADEVLFMMAYSTLVTGLVILFGSGNNVHISRIIGRGQLEHLFTQPLPLALQLLTSGFLPFTGSGNFLIGIGLMVVAIQRLAIAVTFGWLLQLTAYLLATLVILVARAYLVSTLAFLAPVAAEEISTTVIEGTWFLSTFPLAGMPSYIRVPLLTVLPEGLIAWFPAMCLLGRAPFRLAGLYQPAFALLLALIANIIFRKGLNIYVTRGTNRYVPYGFRR